MSGRATVSWQTSLADLSLILFMVTAAAVSHADDTAKPSAAAAAGAATADKRQVFAAPSPIAEPLSVYIAAPGTPPLTQWLAQQASDPRQQLTITAQYAAGSARTRETALSSAIRLAREAGQAGLSARIVIEPGKGPTRAVLAFDTPGGAP